MIGQRDKPLHPDWSGTRLAVRMSRPAPPTPPAIWNLMPDSNSPPSLVSGQQPVGIQAAVLALLISALWAGTPAAIKYSVETFSPVTVAALRFSLGAAFMVFWCRFEGTPLWPGPGQWGAVTLAGVLLFVQISLFNEGVAWSNATHSSLMINTFVFWVVLIEHFITRVDRLSARKGVGLILAAFGAVLVLLTDGHAEPSAAAPQGSDLASNVSSVSGDLLLLLSAVVLAVKITFIKQSLKYIEPGKLILWHDVVGVVLFGAWALALEQPVHDDIKTTALLAIAYQGLLVAGLCFAIQTMLLRRHSASRISMFAFATPLFGIVAGVALRGDALSPWLLVSAACVALGIALVNMPARERNDAAQPGR
jgi:drug/metabolite transporter (DMT)-like permease